MQAKAGGEPFPFSDSTRFKVSALKEAGYVTSAGEKLAVFEPILPSGGKMNDIGIL